ncbi:nSTAND1 domain-containing NTPase [Thermocoleostomius sinensis]|uniref:Caspase family protein n=1 Tax=Thermocoleostomius sinensis A174 TaxID=2016057 RepID=A0A9E9C8Y6_9CYAN|nr:caspase family protein [Thermocoleostomius sinensis]WAL58937.1 caspase family protein [Thermocoleostomius sinensis A174]
MRDALVVGINTYQSLPNLKAPARDAEAIAQMLQSQGEFRVHRVPEVIQAGKTAVGQKTQVTLRELETALINLFKPKGNHCPQTALFYFSGHGLQREAGIQEGYLALSDSHPDKGFYGLSLFWLRRLLQESPVRQRIIMLDCCHSGELLNFLEADPGAQSGIDRLFMAASREYETAFESLDSPYSVFTQAILTGLEPRRVESGIVTNHSLTDYVNHALKGEIQQPLFESSGSEIVLTRQTGLPTATPTVIKSTDICPYRGLESFDEAHADFFFGREDLTETLITKLKADRFVAVVGASGIGKSSLVRAGMLTRLRREKTATGDDRWRIKFITPTRHPLKGLAATFIDAAASDLERAEQLRRAEEFLQDGGNGLAQLVRASLPIHSTSSELNVRERSRLLLVVDQFEEVFTLSQGSEAEQERQQFFNCLLGAAELAKDCLSLVIVLRTDFLPKCLLYEGLASQIEHHQLMVMPLKYEQIKATIVRPAQKAGLVCEPNLVYTMLLDISGAPGELPLLQYTLLELWQRRRVNSTGSIARLTLEAYQELGGVRGTLQKRATDVFYSLTEPEQAIAKRIFLALTQLGDGTEDTRRRVAKSELISPAYPTELVDRVLEKLVKAKLIVTNQDVDVVHEALIRNWSLLRTWLTEHRETLRRSRRVEQSAQEWDRAGQPPAGDYLLSGLRLEDAEDLLKNCENELSTLAQKFITVSREESRQARRESWQLQIAVPSVLLAALTIVFSQYYKSVESQAERVQQLQTATSRERAAIAQSILQETNSDPMSALLVSRLAAEQGRGNVEAQSSLRAALQALRLQLELSGHTGGVHQITFSPNQRYLATASADGTIRLWAIHPQTIYNTSLEPSRVLLWSTSGHRPDSHGYSDRGVEPCQNLNCTQTSEAAVDVVSVRFSPDSRLIAAIAKDSATVKIWSVESSIAPSVESIESNSELNSARLQLTAPSIVTQAIFSPNGQWIATAHEDRSISIWQVSTGQLVTRIPNAHITQTQTAIQFTTDGRYLLSSSSDRTLQLWQLLPQANHKLTVEKAATLTHPTTINHAVISPSGQWVAIADMKGEAHLWNIATGHQVKTLKPPDASPTSQLPVPITQLQFSPTESILAIADADYRLQLWNLNSGKLWHTLTPVHGSDTVTNSRIETALEAANKPEITPALQAPRDLLSFNPTGTILATAKPNTAKPSDSHSVYLWNTQTGERIGTLPGHNKPVEALQFSPDGTYIATASADGLVRLWAAETGGELPTIQLPDAAIEWATFLENAPASIQPVSTTPFSSPTALLPPKNQNLLDQKASHNDSILASHSAILSNREVGQFNQPLSPDKVVKAEKALVNLVTVSASGRLQRWQIVADPLVLSPPAQFANSIVATTTAPSQGFGQQVLALLTRPFHGFAITSHQTIGSIPAKISTTGAPPSTDPRQSSPPITTASMAHSMHTVTSIQIAPNAQQSLSSVTLSADGRLLATATPEGWIEIFQIEANQSTTLLHRIQNRRMFPDRNSRLDTVTLESIPTLQFTSFEPTSAPSLPAPTRSLAAPSPSLEPITLRHLSFSSDNRFLLGLADDFTVRLWDVQSGRSLHIWQGHQATVQQARFSPDGQWVASASWDQTVRIWHVSSGRLQKTIPHPDSVSSVSFSADSQQLVSASWDGIARVFDVRTGEQQLSLNGHQPALLDAAFSPDGTLIATASASGIAQLWSAQTGLIQAELMPNRSGAEAASISQVFFSPDSQYLATLTKDGKVHLWAATWEMLLKLARDRSLRQLSQDECNRYLKLTPEECPALVLGSR